MGGGGGQTDGQRERERERERDGGERGEREMKDENTHVAVMKS